MSKKRTRVPRSVQFADRSTAVPAAERSTLTAQIVTADDFTRFLGYMPNPDEILRDTGEAVSIYREMKTDPRIKSLLGLLKTAVMNHPFRIRQGEASDDVFSFVSKAPIFRRFSREIRELLSAIDFGFSVSELEWALEHGWWLPTRIISHRPERFVFDSDGGLVWRHFGELVPLTDEHKWLVYQFESEAENPYGSSILKACYWAWKFKRAGLEFWLLATEKFSVPSIIALFESQGDEDKLRERAASLSQMLSTMTGGSGGAVANVKQIQPLEMAGSLEMFQTLVDWCDTQMAYGLAGASLAVQEAQNGSRAQAVVHEDMFFESAKGIARDIEPVLQEIIDWMVELNFGPDAVAPSGEFDLDDYASWDEVAAAIDREIPVSKEALYSRYGLPRPADDEDSFLKPATAQAPGGFAFADDGKKKAPGQRPRPHPGVVLLPRRTPSR